MTFKWELTMQVGESRRRHRSSAPRNPLCSPSNYYSLPLWWPCGSWRPAGRPRRSGLCCGCRPASWTVRRVEGRGGRETAPRLPLSPPPSLRRVEGWRTGQQRGGAPVGGAGGRMDPGGGAGRSKWGGERPASPVGPCALCAAVRQCSASDTSRTHGRRRHDATMKPWRAALGGRTCGGEGNGDGRPAPCLGHAHRHRCHRRRRNAS